MTLAAVPRRPVAVVHPQTVDRSAFAAAVETRLRAAGWPAPTWCWTSPEEAGTGQAAEALRGGADLVICCGGDGPVRAVAQALLLDVGDAGSSCFTVMAGVGLERWQLRTLEVRLTVPVPS